MPFTYLGLPMGTNKPRIEHYAPIMNEVERQLTSILSMLTHAGRLQLVNIVISSSLIYTMCFVSIPIVVHEYVDRARRHCMRRNNNTKGKCLVVWMKCTKPKRRGVSIINLRSQNNDMVMKSQNNNLLMKHLDKFYNRRNIP
jgi:hypothetical protein